MDFHLSEAEKSVGLLAERILGDLVSDASLRALEQGETWVHAAAWQALAEAGLLGVALPERHGGAELGLLALCELLRKVGRATAPLPALSTLVMGTLPLARFGTDAQRERYLPGVAHGRVLLTAALEQQGSRDLHKPTVIARATEAGLTLDGTCVQVPGLPEAAAMLVPATDSERTQTVLCVISPRASGVSLQRTTATNGEPLHTVELSGVRCEPSEIVAEGERGAEALRYAAQVTSLGASALCLGVAERALARTASYVSERHQFGRPIGSFQAVSQRAGDAYIDVLAMEVSLWQAAFRLHQELPAAREVALARLTSIECAHRVVMASQHLHGGIGFDRDYPLHRSLLWAKRLENVVGGSELQLERLGTLLVAETP
jgi:alkylation response protein AidB-like acyl-CoA dehydrogenase